MNEHKREVNEQKQKEENEKKTKEERERFQMKHGWQWHTFKMNSQDACDRYAKFNHRQQHTQTHPLNISIYQLSQNELRFQWKRNASKIKKKNILTLQELDTL